MREQPQLLIDGFGDDGLFGDVIGVGADKFAAIVGVDVVVELVIVAVADVVVVEFVASNCRFWLWCLLFSFIVNGESNGESRTSSS